MSEIEHYMEATGRLVRELDKTKRALTACAYWAANGLQAIECRISRIMLYNILKESKEYVESEPGRDSNIMYGGIEYSYTPVGGFLPDSNGEWAR